MFSENSRYRDLPIKSYVQADGSTRRYVARRIIPDPSRLQVMATVPVTDSERLDLLAHRHLGDPTLFWRIADANAAMDPSELLSADRKKLDIPNLI